MSATEGAQEQVETRKFNYTVTIECETVEQADRVIAERLDHDEDYGFDYTIVGAVMHQSGRQVVHTDGT